MHPRRHALAAPDKPAVVMADTGQALSYGELVGNANRLARVLRDRGLKTGDGIASLVENHLRYFEAPWAAIDTGLYFSSISTYLTPQEAAHIVNDSGARVLVTSLAQAETVRAMLPLTPGLELVLALDGVFEGAESYDAALAGQSDALLDDETAGALLLYSSGTTGAPSGIKPALTGASPDEPAALFRKLSELYGLDRDSVYLSTAPLYHTAPLKWNLTVQTYGGTSVIMPRFDAEAALAAIERHHVTHAQFVPTMFVRLLRLPADTRARCDLSSLKAVVHAAAPCPFQVKRRMIEWLGPIIHEYYAGTESNGMCAVTCEEWLVRPGTVGRAVRGAIHITDMSGEQELPAGEPGLVFFDGGTPFSYHNSPVKTARGRNSRGWTTIGDIGFLDEDGYLFLTDRRDDVIISGGVNVYPFEIEQVLSAQDGVLDCAVISAPDAEFGEAVRAVIQASPAADKAKLEVRLRAACVEKLAAYKRPRAYDFVEELPRLPTGKLLKRVLRDSYWGKPAGDGVLAERLITEDFT
jgi:acyl-CoA synthetase (AMP-forming)/AMP-acid ligase II